MKDLGRMCWLGLGLAAGIAATILCRAEPMPVWAGNDRHEDYVMATGPVTIAGNFTADGIWLLDYRAGKLLGTVVDRNLGKIVGWAEVDLVKEFNIPPKQNVHFMMTTGSSLQPNNVGLLIAPAPGPVPPGKPPVPPNVGNPGINVIGNPGLNAGANAALYLTEINTGRFGVYTMAPAMDGTNRVVIRRHDATLFRQPAAQ